MRRGAESRKSPVSPPAARDVLIASDPERANVTIEVDGTKKMEPSPTVFQLRPGRYRVMVEKEGYGRIEEEIEVVAEPGVLKKTFQLTPSQPVAKPPAARDVLIASDPERANVTIEVDGTKKMEPSPTVFQLRPGRYRVVVEKEGYGRIEEEIEVVAEPGVLKKTFQLTPSQPVAKPPAARDVLIASDPERANVTIEVDGAKKMEPSPTVFQLRPGRYRVVVEKEGYSRIEEEIEVVAEPGVLKKTFQLTQSQPVAKPPAAREVLIASDPERANVTIEVDGAKKMEPSPTVFQLRPGRYRVVVEKEGYRRIEEEIEVVAEPGVLKKTFQLTPSQPVAQAEGGAGNNEPSKLITNSIGMKLTLIPAGTFLMGSPDSDKNAHDDEKPQHRVRITRPFYLGVYEVTRGQFRRFVDDSGYQTEAEKDGKGGCGWNEDAKKFEQNPRYTWLNPGFEQTDLHPVVNVSWNDAVAFAEWLGRKEGRTYRLPTEAEWEYACRAGTTTLYFPGDDAEALAEVGNVADATAREKYPDWTYAIAVRDGFVYTAPVGRYRLNAWGLHDMHGNVWEWVPGLVWKGLLQGLTCRRSRRPP